MTVVCLPNCVFLSETWRMLTIHRALEEQGVAAVMARHGERSSAASGAEGPAWRLTPHAQRAVLGDQGLAGDSWWPWRFGHSDRIRRSTLPTQ